MRGRGIRWDRWALAAVVIFMAVAGGIGVRRRASSPVSKVSIGGDQVFCTREATAADALTLGHALRGTGYFHGANNSAMLSKHGTLKVVSFAVDEGAWSHPATIAAFEEIGRRIAGAIGGFPIQVQLTDTRWSVHRSMRIGKVLSNTNDVVYYFGSATEDQAIALSLALTDAGYLGSSGATVVVSKDGTNSLGFVVADGVWNRTDAVSGFEQLIRRVARHIGGLPVQLRLLDSNMEPRKEVTVE